MVYKDADALLDALAKSDVERGFVKVSYNSGTLTEMHVFWDEKTGELMLVRHGKLLLSTRKAGAFNAGLRLLCGVGDMVVWHGFVLLADGPGYEWVDRPPADCVSLGAPPLRVMTYGAPHLLPDIT